MISLLPESKCLGMTLIGNGNGFNLVNMGKSTEREVREFWSTKVQKTSLI